MFFDLERVRDIELMRGMVANGFGYALANIRYRAKTAPDGKAVKSIPLESSLRPMKLGLVTRKGEHRPRVVRAFEDHCREVIEDKRLSGLYPT